MLKFESVSRIYDDGTRAVDDVSLHVKKGEFCVLLGPSGAGKSTLMNMVNGVVVPSSGNLIIGGEILSKRTRSSIQRRVGMIHQQLHLVAQIVCTAQRALRSVAGYRILAQSAEVVSP